MRADHQQIARAEPGLDVRDGTAADDRDAAIKRPAEGDELRRPAIGHMDAVGGIGDLDQRAVAVEEKRERLPGRQLDARRGWTKGDAFVYEGKEKGRQHGARTTTPSSL